MITNGNISRHCRGRDEQPFLARRGSGPFLKATIQSVLICSLGLLLSGFTALADGPSAVCVWSGNISGPYEGTAEHPYSTLIDGVYYVATNGSIQIGGQLAERTRITKPCVLTNWPEKGQAIIVGTTNYSDEQKLALLTQYAPRIMLHPSEDCFPSSVEYIITNTTRTIYYDENTKQDEWWLFVPNMTYYDCSIDNFPWLAGFNPSTYAVPIYAFWVDKGWLPLGENYGVARVVALAYFTFYPWNQGKEVACGWSDNHVGDWEHMLVVLTNGVPFQVRTEAHGGGCGTCELGWRVRLWDQALKTGDHPVVYAAYHGHGTWFDVDSAHKYCDVGCGKGIILTDETGEGVAWDTWNLVEAYDSKEMTGLGIRPWPLWMYRNYIGRWGNPKCYDCDCGTFGAPCKRDNGPQGLWAKATLTQAGYLH